MLARRDLVTTILLMAIVLGGTAVRFVGVAAGRPFVYHPDEGVVVKAAMRMTATGDWNPHTFLYPSLLIDIVAGIATIGHAIAAWPLATSQSWLFPAEALPEQFDAYLAGRVFVAVLGGATVLVTFAIGRRLGGRLAGLLAAAVVALAPVHIESSQTVTTDVPVTLFCALVLLFSIRAVDEPDRRRWWVIAAVCVGLAASTKWNGIAVGIVPAALYLTSRVRPISVSALLRSPTPWLMLGAGALAFIVTTPAVVLAPGEVADGLATQAAAYSSAAYAALRGPGEPNSVIIEIQSLVEGFGPALVVVAVLAILGLLAARRQFEFAIALFIVVYVAILSIPVLHYPRNALPALPYLGIGIGLLPTLVARALSRRAPAADAVGSRLGSTPVVRLAVAALLLVLMVPAVTQDIADARRSRAADTRSVAYAWVLANVPRNAIVAREQYTPQLTPDPFRLRKYDGLYQRSMASYRDQRVQYLIASSAIYGRFLGNLDRPFDDAFYRALFQLPEVFHIEPGADRPGPTIRIFKLDPGPAGG